jgi:hypothetical protein
MPRRQQLRQGGKRLHAFARPREAEGRGAEPSPLVRDVASEGAMFTDDGHRRTTYGRAQRRSSATGSGFSGASGEGGSRLPL